MATPNLLERVYVAARRKRVRGADRAIQFLRGNNLAYPIRTVTTHGLTIFADPLDWVDRAVLMNGYYELEVFDAIRAQLRPDDVFWDIGANIGLHALTVRHTIPSVRCVCFEPSPFTFTRLFQNAQANQSAVTLMDIALSNESGYRELGVTIGANSGMTSLVPGWTDSPQLTMPCRCERADALIADGVVPAPNVIKLDVEGHEIAALEGFGDVLNAPLLRAVIFEGDRASHLLELAGFRVSAIAKHRGDDNDTPNFLATR